MSFISLNPQEKNLITLNCLNSADFAITKTDTMSNLCKTTGMKAVEVIKNTYDVSEQSFELHNGKSQKVAFTLGDGEFCKFERRPMDVISYQNKLYFVFDCDADEKITVVVKKYFQFSYIKSENQNTKNTLLGFVDAKQGTNLKFLTEKNKIFRLINSVSIPGFIDENTLSFNSSTFSFDCLPSLSHEGIFKTIGARPKFLEENSNTFGKPLKLELEMPINDQKKQSNHCSLIFVQCNAEPGSVLQLRGEGCSGLSWNEGIALTHVFGDLWALATDIDVSRAKAKLVKVASNGTVVWEKGENRTFTNDAIQACIPQIEGSELPSDGKQEVQKEPLIIKFKAEAQDNGKLMLRGEGGGLAWHTGKPLTSLGHDLWACEITSSDNEKITFKIVKEYPENKVYWETTPNRSFTPGQNPVVLDAVNTTFAP